jgi:hypothetical protein
VIPAFNVNKGLIDHSVTNKLKDIFISPHMQIIIDHLGETILAALILGDLDLIRYELSWAEGLMANRDIPSEQLRLFLTSYRDACGDTLGIDGEPITRWLDDYLQNKDWGDE